MDTGLFELSGQHAWLVLGRTPVALVLVALTWAASKSMGAARAALGLSAFCAGAMVGTALLPSILGVLTGGVVATLLAWRLLGARLPGVAPFVYGMLAIVAVGRVGCLIAGCCFGHVTAVAWAVHYPVGSFAQVLHRELGLVGAAAPSLPVHPVQAYESLALFALLAVAPWLKRVLKSDGAWALLVAAAYLAVRAAVDPLRAMVNTPSSLKMLGPASAFQWAALLASAACALGALWWWQRSRKPPAVAAAVQQLPLGHRAALLWMAQAGATLATQSEGTWLLRVLAVGSLTASAAFVLFELGAQERGRSVAYAAAALVLVFPLALRAADGPRDDEQSRWLYTAVPGSRHLVRIGTSATPGPQLIGRYLALVEEPVSPPADGAPAVDGGATDGGVVDGRPLPPPPLVQGPPSEEPRPLEGVEVPKAEKLSAPRRLDVGFVVLGGQQTYVSPGCSSTSAYQSFVRVGATVEAEAENGNYWQARASFVFNESGPIRTVVPTPGAQVSASGLFEWKWELASLGLGFGAGAGNLGLFDPWIGLGDASSNTLRAQLVPLLYVRLEFFKGVAFEFGTGSRFQPVEGAFAGFRIGADGPDAFAGRFGIESVWLPYPLANTTFFVDLAFPAGKLNRLCLRLEGKPASPPQTRLIGSTPSVDASVSGGARFIHSF
jgi:hypothetical protein